MKSDKLHKYKWWALIGLIQNDLNANVLQLQNWLTLWK